MRRVGNLASVPEKIQSTSEPMALAKVMVELTIGGASGDVAGIFDDDPMCMLMTVSVSSQARKNGSQKPSLECTDGRPRGVGFSVKATAWLPLSAQRRISSPAATGSHKGMMVRGMSFPLPSPPHHSSIIQSL